jgi:threonine/homoserine/homoserine lactone efflux protein
VQETAALFGIAGAIALGAASPGPSFVMVARTAVAATRADGLWAALGMGTGGLGFACLSLLGLHGVLLAVPTLYLALKALGGLYLAWLGIRIWRGASQPLAIATTAPGARSTTAPRATAPSPLRSFALGLSTQASNPKTAIWYASVFAAFLPPAPSLGFDVAIATAVFLIESGWYTLVALALSAERPRQVYLRFKPVVDRTAGAVVIALGLKLIVSARP